MCGIISKVIFRIQTKERFGRNMGLRFCSFASGSTGNSYLVRTDNTAILVDCGIAGKRIIAGLDSAGLGPEDLSAIFITHEHSDHVLSIRMMSKKAANADMYATRGTIRGIGDKVQDGRMSAILAGDSLKVGDIDVESFHVSHDAADPVGYTFRADGRALTILTDTGVVTDDIYDHVKNTNAIVLEANHEVNILRAGPYPFELQQRILSDRGHLSNDAAGELLCRMLDDGDFDEEDPLFVLLAHISRNNNTPDQAYITVQNVLFEDDHYVDKDVVMDVARYDKASPLYEV